MIDLAWVVAAFLAGSLPLSVWLGTLLLGKDIRRYGDGNPGGTNVYRASGKRLLGALAIGLDMLKAALPVALAYYLFEVDGWWLAAVIAAPILGHAFSPFLKWRGGKALAAACGAWTALTVPFGPFVMTFSLLALSRVVPPGWAVMGALAALLVNLAILGLNWSLVVAWVATLAILLFKHRHEFARATATRPVNTGGQR